MLPSLLFYSVCILCRMPCGVIYFFISIFYFADISKNSLAQLHCRRWSVEGNRESMETPRGPFSIYIIIISGGIGKNFSTSKRKLAKLR